MCPWCSSSSSVLSRGGQEKALYLQCSPRPRPSPWKASPLQSSVPCLQCSSLPDTLCKGGHDRLHTCGIVPWMGDPQENLTLKATGSQSQLQCSSGLAQGNNWIQGSPSYTAPGCSPWCCSGEGACSWCQRRQTLCPQDSCGLTSLSS